MTGAVASKKVTEALSVVAVCSELNVVGCDVNELSPHYDISGVSTAVGCKIVREMLLALKASEA